MAVALRGVQRRFRRHSALRDISYDVGRGEIVGLLGPNGAGKTTTLKIIGGLLAPTAGRVEVLGLSMPASARQVLRQTGVTIESPGYYRHLSLESNISAFARAKGCHLTDAARGSLLDSVGLYDNRNTRASKASTGMRQRMALAIALIGEPQLLALDEPASGLDPAGLREIRQVLVSRNNAGTAVLLSSHLLSEVEMLCHRVVVIQEGTILYDGELSNLVGGESVLVVTTSHPDTAAKVILSAGMTGWQTPGGTAIVGVSDTDARSLLEGHGIVATAYERRSRTLEEAYLSLLDRRTTNG